MIIPLLGLGGSLGGRQAAAAGPLRRAAAGARRGGGPGPRPAARAAPCRARGPCGPGVADGVECVVVRGALLLGGGVVARVFHLRRALQVDQVEYLIDRIVCAHDTNDGHWPRLEIYHLP